MKKLRYYQGGGKNDIFSRWEENDITMFVLATGGGKTVTFTEVIRDIIAQGKRVLLIAHRKELIEQSWNTLRLNGIVSGIIMNEYPEHPERPVQVCSIQTIARRKTLPHADYIIVDEGHHAQRENQYGKIIDRFVDAKVLLVTATPYRLSGEGFEYVHPYKKTSLIINKTLKQLIYEGFLVPIKYFIASVPELEDAHIERGDYVEEDTFEAMKLAPLVESYIEHANGRRGVVFAINIMHSKQIVAQYNNAGIKAMHLDGDTPDDDYYKDGRLHLGRKSIIDKFRAREITIIVNVGIITEGFDFPDMNFVQLACPTKSLSKYCQMIGRGTRAETGILDPYPEEGQAEERLRAIAASGKPDCIVLDNAGCWIDNGLPDSEIDWVEHFRGKKNKKKAETQEEMQILVFIAEAKDGSTVRSVNAKEIEGMRLIEVTKETRKKAVNIKSIHEFDRLFALFKRLPQVKKSGYVTFREFFKHCERSNIIIVDAIWEYMHTRLLKENKAKIDSLMLDKAVNPGKWDDNSYMTQIKKITSEGVSEEFFREEYRKYCIKNKAQIEAYLLG